MQLKKYIILYDELSGMMKVRSIL